MCIRDRFRRILLENILRENQGEEYPLTPDDLAAVEKLRAERYATWEWNYGRSPACTMLRRRRVDGCGLIEAYITVEHGLISVVAFKGDVYKRQTQRSRQMRWRFLRKCIASKRYITALKGNDAFFFCPRHYERSILRGGLDIRHTERVPFVHIRHLIF